MLHISQVVNTPKGRKELHQGFRVLTGLRIFPEIYWDLPRIKKDYKFYDSDLDNKK